MTMQFDNLGVYERHDDIEAETGIEVQFPNGISFKILRAGGANRKYQRALIKHMTPAIRRKIDSSRLSPEEEETLWRSIYVDSIIIDMKGAKSGGKEVPYSAKNVDALLKAAPDMLEELRNVADKLSSFRAQEIAEEAENLGNSSGGTLSGVSTKKTSSEEKNVA